MQIFQVLHVVPYSNQTPVKDVIASLHSYFTCNLLIGLAVLVSYKQFGGKPIECMLPMLGESFSGAWEQYVEQFCWSEDTYYVPFNETIEAYTTDQRRDKRISYYQWIPFFLLFQAACFKAPTLVWKYFAGQSGMRLGEILRLSTSESNAEAASRSSNIHALCVHLQGALRFQLRLKTKNLMPHKIVRILNLKYTSYYVFMIYLLSKLCFLANVLLQTHLLGRYFIPNASEAFGFHAWKNLWYGNLTWEQSALFPRVTLCDFTVREMGQTRNFTVQCVLLLNIFTEKTFVILWSWYNMIALITLMNLTSWAFTLANPRSSEHFILNHLEMSGKSLFSNETAKGLSEVQTQVRCFIDKYLKTDGIFVLRMVAQHADVIFTTDLIGALWDSHYEIEKKRQENRLRHEKLKPHLERFNIIDKRAAGTIDGGGGDDEIEDKQSVAIHMNSSSPVKHTQVTSFDGASRRTTSPPKLKRTSSFDAPHHKLRSRRSLINEDEFEDDAAYETKLANRRESKTSFTGKKH